MFSYSTLSFLGVEGVKNPDSTCVGDYFMLACTQPYRFLVGVHISSLKNSFFTVRSRPQKLSFERVKGGHHVCVLRRHVRVDMVLALFLRALVGCFEYIKLSRAAILAWV